MTSSVKLSFCMPVYNREEFVSEAIESVLKLKNPKNYELVIVDGGSTDKTSLICASYAKKFSQIKYFRDKKNYGFLDGFKKCIQYTHGRYLFFVPSDDILLLRSFDPLIKKMDDNDNLAIISTNLRLFTYSVVNYSKNVVFFKGTKKFRAGKNALYHWVTQSTLASVGGALFRSKIAKKYINLVPDTANYFPMMYLGGLIADRYNVLHYNCFSFAQRLSNETHQMANKQYLSMSVFEELLLLINSFNLDRTAKKKLLRLNVDGYVGSLISMRCFARFTIYLRFVSFLIKNNPFVLLKPKFYVYLFISLLVPKIILFKLLKLYRHRKRWLSL